MFTASVANAHGQASLNSYGLLPPMMMSSDLAYMSHPTDVSAGFYLDYVVFEDVAAEQCQIKPLQLIFFSFVFILHSSIVEKHYYNYTN